MKLFGRRTNDSADDALLAVDARSRRDLIVGAAGALGVIAAGVVGQAAPALAGTDGDVVLGAQNNETATTSITNTASGDGFMATGGGDGNGVIGDGGTGAGAGVVGTGGATDGHGVVGNGTGKGTGVKGTSPSGTGVHGSSGSTLDNATALTGVITSTTPGHGSAGVFGKNNGTGADGTGVLGMHAGTGFGVHGQSDGVGVWGESSSGTGVHGTSGSVADNASAILGEITTTSPGGFSAGVRGINDGTGVNGIGVEGTHAGSGWGVHGKSVSGAGIRGESPNGIGVHGISDSTTAGTSAIFGHITSTTPGAGSAGVRGQNDGTGNDGIGVDGLHAGSGLGVHGRSESGIGVKAEAGSAGTALHVEGKATFQRSGRVNIKAGFNGIVLHPINLTSSSKVFATAQNIIGGVFVEAAAPDPAHSRITIRLSKRVPAGFTAKVAWFILD